MERNGSRGDCSRFGSFAKTVKVSEMVRFENLEIRIWKYESWKQERMVAECH